MKQVLCHLQLAVGDMMFAFLVAQRFTDTHLLAHAGGHKPRRCRILPVPSRVCTTNGDIWERPRLKPNCMAAEISQGGCWSATPRRTTTSITQTGHFSTFLNAGWSALSRSAVEQRHVFSPSPFPISFGPRSAAAAPDSSSGSSREAGHRDDTSSSFRPRSLASYRSSLSRQGPSNQPMGVR